MAQVTLTHLRRHQTEGTKFAVLTAYDASFAGLISAAGVEVILVGDSLGMVLQGHDSTLPVTVAQTVYHVECVARGNQGSLIMADLPFASYATPAAALDNAAQLMRAGAHMVKLEGGAEFAKTVSLLTANGIPVCAHLGLTPQSINQLGGYRIQGKDEAQAQKIIDDAKALEAAGASIQLLECIPTRLAEAVTEALSIPTIGIGAGPGTTAQVLVMHDLIGVATDYTPKFVKNFLADADSIQQAVADYVTAVKAGTFPGPEHSYQA